MQSEIPQLEVVTAIGDAEAEDYIAQLLFSQGWNIVNRAFDMQALKKFFESRPPNLRTVLVFRKDLPNFTLDELDNFISPTTTMISLDEIPLSAHQVMSHIRTQLRLPLIINKPQISPALQSVQRFQKIIVTGTSGAPGKSTIAVNLALEAEFSIYDLDFRNPSITYLLERNDLEISEKKLVEEKPREINSNENSIYDIGLLPSISEMVNDRRWQAVLLNSLFDTATNLIYVSKSNGLSLLRLEKFINDFPILLRKIPIVYVLNQAGNSREERAMERKFLKMVSGERSLVIPSDIRIANPSKRGNKSIGKLAELVD